MILSTLRWFWQLTPTDRTHFIVWLDHQVGFALGAFDAVEFDSLDVVRFQGAIHATLPL